MPGLVGFTTLPTPVLPQTLCLAFTESREYPQLKNVYHDGTQETGQLGATSRRTFKLTKRLPFALLSALRTFYENVNGPLQPFLFYNPYEGHPIGSNFDATGVNTVGRYIVKFGSTWNQTTDLQRSSVPDIQLIELDYNTLIGTAPLLITAATLSARSEYINTSAITARSAITAIDGSVFVSNTGTPYAERVDTYAYTSGDLANLNLNRIFLVAFWIDSGSAVINNVAGISMRLYDAFLTVTYSDTTSAIFKPSSFNFVYENGSANAGFGIMTNPQFAFDADITTFAQVVRTDYDLLNFKNYINYTGVV